MIIYQQTNYIHGAIFTLYCELVVLKTQIQSCFRFVVTYVASDAMSWLQLFFGELLNSVCM